MIQRKQSLYLVLAVILQIVGLFEISTRFIDVKNFAASELTNFAYTAFDSVVTLSTSAAAGANTVVATTNYLYSILGVILIAAAAVSAWAVCMFANRRKQMRMCNLAVFITLIYYIARFCCVISIASKLHFTFGVNMFDALPLVSIVLVLMARAAINKDDKLVRAADRIR